MVYIIADGTDCVKIGTASNLKARLRALQTGNPRNIYAIKSILTPDRGTDFEVEHALHKKYEKHRVVTENGTTEWFCGEAAEEAMRITVPDICDVVSRYCRWSKITNRDIRVIDHSAKQQDYEIDFIKPLVNSRIYSILVSTGFKTVNEVWEYLFERKQVIPQIGWKREQDIKAAIEQLTTWSVGTAVEKWQQEFDYH